VGRGDLTEAQRTRPAPLLPVGIKSGRPPGALEAATHRRDPVHTRAGVPWRQVPERYGPWQTVYGARSDSGSALRGATVSDGDAATSRREPCHLASDLVIYRYRGRSARTGRETRTPHLGEARSFDGGQVRVCSRRDVGGLARAG